MFKYTILSLFATISFGLQASDVPPFTLKPEHAIAYGLYEFKEQDGVESVDRCLLIIKIKPSGKRFIDQRNIGKRFRVIFEKNNGLAGLNDAYDFIVLDKEQDTIKLDGKHMVLSLSDEILAKIKEVPTKDNQFIHLLIRLDAEEAQEVWAAQEPIASEQDKKTNVSNILKQFKKWFD